MDSLSVILLYAFTRVIAYPKATLRFSISLLSRFSGISHTLHHFGRRPLRSGAFFAARIAGCQAAKDHCSRENNDNFFIILIAFAGSPLITDAKSIDFYFIGYFTI